MRHGQGLQLSLFRGSHLINTSGPIIIAIVTMPVQTNVFHVNDININFKPKSVDKKGERNRQDRAGSK